MNIKPITVKSDCQGQRLDKFLLTQLPEKTRSQIQKLVKSGGVLVNGQPAKVHHFLRTGEIIEISDKKPETIISSAAPPPTAYGLEPKIISETPDFLVLEKPVGLLVHPTDKGETDTLVDWLKQKYPAISEVGDQKYRAGIIHRLDRDVSGVMVIAKNNPAFNHLKLQFKNRKVKKEYIALVYGKVTQPEGEINLPIGRSKDGQFVAHPRRGARKFQRGDKIAKTRYEVLEYLKDYTLLKVRILTGRTHQIRAHFSAIGHPIIGDRLYQPKKKIFHFLRRKIKVINPGRIFLHSQKIGFFDLNGIRREYESPVPEALNIYINEKKSS